MPRKKVTAMPATMPQDAVSKAIDDRASRYGAFKDNAIIAQGLSDMMRATPGWARLAPDMRESLEMQMHKIARILCGDSAYLDNWLDLAGYSRLVYDRLISETKTKKRWKL